MNEAGSLPGEVGMIGPFDSLYEQPKPRFIFKMPRVVPDQKHKFETDELFRRLSRESEVSNAVYYCKYEYYFSILLIFLQLHIVDIFFVAQLSIVFLRSVYAFSVIETRCYQLPRISETNVNRIFKNSFITS